ncbi:MAG: hypothetical protein AAB840_02335 [Patescibacteria group bacterium]
MASIKMRASSRVIRLLALEFLLKSDGRANLTAVVSRIRDNIVGKTRQEFICNILASDRSLRIETVARKKFLILNEGDSMVKTAKKKDREGSSQRLTHEEFVKKAVVKLRTPKSKGIHAVFSGFNGAFREYFGEDPVEAVKALDVAGKIVCIPCKRGAMLYLPEEAPTKKLSFNEALAKMGIK